MRFTHKLEEPEGNCNYFLIPDREQCDNAENKLGQLEDIEDEFGVELTTLSNALKNGIYLKIDISEEPLFVDLFSITRLHSGKILLTFSDKQLKSRYFKDYGKTWALTKEELE